MAAAVAAVLLTSGGGSTSAHEQPRHRQAQKSQPGDRAHRAKQRKPAAKSQPAEQTPAAPPLPETPRRVSAVDPAHGAQLNEQGYALLRRGDYAGAVPILQQAVDSWPPGSQDINLAYALYNLGKALNRAGRPGDAIPYLERRLGWDDQRATVQAELDLARRNAGQG